MNPIVQTLRNLDINSRGGWSDQIDKYQPKDSGHTYSMAPGPNLYSGLRQIGKSGGTFNREERVPSVRMWVSYFSLTIFWGKKVRYTTCIPPPAHYLQPFSPLLVAPMSFVATTSFISGNAYC